MPAYTTGEIIAPPEGYSRKDTCCICDQKITPANTMLIDTTDPRLAWEALMGIESPTGCRHYDPICIPCTLNR